MAVVLPTFVCELALGNNPGDAALTWTDVSAYLRGFQITRGRQYELNQMQAGTCAITLKNTDRRFDPTYASSPYYPNLRPMLPVRLRSPKVKPTDGTLTMSGGEITDASRATSGDGIATPGGVGIWETTTNLCTNGGLESNTTGWFGSQGTETLARDTSTAVFGTASLKTTTPGSVSLEGARVLVTPAPATTYTFSFWAKVASGTLSADIRVSNGTDGVVLLQPITLTSTWQRFSGTLTTISAVSTSFGVVTASAVATNFWLDGVQVEQKAFATPYVETNGSTATRTANRVRETASGDFTTTTGCAVVRYAPGFSTAGTMPGGGTGKEYLFDWRDDANNRISGYFDEASKKFTIERYNGGVGNAAQSAVQTLVADTAVEVEFSWSATQIGVRVNGGTKTTAANANIPTLASTTFDWGATFAVGTPTAGTSQCDGRILWAATYSTVPNDADALTIAQVTATPSQAPGGLWDHDASVLLWPATASVTSYWPAVGSGYRIASDAILFTGYVERFPQNRTGPTYAETQIQAVDGFELLTNSVLPGATYPQELSGTRVGRVLDAVSWSTSARNIAAGQSQMISYTFASTDLVQPLQHLQDVSQSELGFFFIAGDGRATFFDRRTESGISSQGTFTDQPAVDTTAIGYADVVASYDKDLIFNDWRGTRSGGVVVQEAQDTSSIAQYFLRTQSRTPLLPTDSETLSQMQFLNALYKQPVLRISDLTITPGNTAAAWIQVLAREIGDRITVREHPPGGGTVVQDSYIEHIDLSVGAVAGGTADSVRAKCVWGLLATSTLSFWRAGYSQAGTDTRAGY